MGAYEFSTFATGRNAQDAFSNAVSQAQYENGHAGYTGTIAEKSEFVMIRDSAEQVIVQLKKLFDAPPEYRYKSERIEKWIEDLHSSPTPARIADALMTVDDERVSDKWGPAGCIEVEPGNRYLFFGRASS